MKLAWMVGLLVGVSSTVHATNVCERWKGRVVIGRDTGLSSVCLSGCNARLVDVSGVTERFELDGSPCGRSYAAELKREAPAEQPKEAPGRATSDAVKSVVPEAQARSLDSTAAILGAIDACKRGNCAGAGIRRTR